MLEIKFYTIKQVAEILDITTRTVNTYIKDKKIKAMKIGGKWRINEDDLKEYLGIK